MKNGVVIPSQDLDNFMYAFVVTMLDKPLSLSPFQPTSHSYKEAKIKPMFVFEVQYIGTVCQPQTCMIHCIGQANVYMEDLLRTHQSPVGLLEVGSKTLQCYVSPCNNTHNVTIYCLTSLIYRT